MRSCDEMLELMSAALDGLLTADEQAALDEHLSGCPACSALYEDLRGLRAATLELEEVSAPAGFAGRVMEAVAAEFGQRQADNVTALPAKRRLRLPWRSLATTAAAVVIVIGGVSLLGQLGGRDAGSGSSTADSSTGSAGGSSSAYSSSSASLSDHAASFSLETADAGAKADPAAGGDAAAQAQTEHAIGNDSAVEEGAAEEEAETAKAGVTSTDSADHAAYCGRIILYGEALPEGLEDYEATADDQGNLTYVVPADFFLACLETLEAEAAGLTFTYDNFYSDASSGLIIVEAPS